MADYIAAADLALGLAQSPPPPPVEHPPEPAVTPPPAEAVSLPDYEGQNVDTSA